MTDHKGKRLKTTLNPATRTLFLYLSGVLLLLSALSFIYITFRPPMTQISSPLLDYEHNLELNYQVRLVPNPLYPGETAPKDAYYFMNLVKGISLDARYNLAVSQKTQLRAATEVTAILKAYDSLTKDASPIWQKEYEILPVETRTDEGDRLTVERSVDLDPRFFDSEKTSFTTLTGVEPVKTVLTVEWKVEAATSTYGLLGQPQVAYLNIPISRYFRVSGEPSTQKTGAVTQTVSAQDPRVRIAKIILSAIIPTTALILAYVLFATTSGTTDSIRKECLSIKRKYRGRIVNSTSVPISGSRQVTVTSIEELMRVADELGKLVVATGEEDFTTAFYVFDGDIAYKYEIA